MQSNKELWGSSFKSAPRLGYFIWKGSLSASPILFGITVMPLEAVMSCEFPGKHVMGGRSMLCSEQWASPGSRLGSVPGRRGSLLLNPSSVDLPSSVWNAHCLSPVMTLGNDIFGGCLPSQPNLVNQQRGISKATLTKPDHPPLPIYCLYICHCHVTLGRSFHFSKSVSYV